jgi:hypothetical protein
MPVPRSKHLWVDAICIDQDDLPEKSSQVKQMDKTYACADHVSVWLGLPSIDETLRSRVSDPTMLKTYQVEDFYFSDNMEDLARRDYWNRYWVIQEMLLGRETLIWCGNHAIFWSDFQRELCQHAGVDQFSLSARGWKSDKYPVPALMMGRHIDGYPEIRESLGALLVRHRQSECKDPKDRVFALLGIVEHVEASLLSRFLPDYSLSEREVVIIALAHLTQVAISNSWQSNDVGINSEDIFEAFRIPQKLERRSLLDAAERVDYLGAESVEDIRHQLLHDDSSPAKARDKAVAKAADEFIAMYTKEVLGMGDEQYLPRRQKSNCTIL